MKTATTQTRTDGDGAGRVLDEAVRLDARHRHAAVGLRPPQTLGDHLRGHGPAPLGGAALLDRLEDCGLTGHGGGHFPVAAKWRSVLLGGGTATVVANAAESDPASAKDEVLLRQRPHLVLDGLALAVRVLGAREGVLWLHEASSALDAVAAALRERSTAGLADPPLRVVDAPASYLAGESSAVRRSLAGGPLLPGPRDVPQSLGSPVIQNVETLARVALVARGAVDAADAALVTVLDEGLRTVTETVPAETVAGVVLRTRGFGGPPPRAVLVGGYAGTWVSWEQAQELALAGPTRWAGTGTGLVAVLPYGACGLAETAALLRYLAGSSAGQCGPCVFGLPSLADLADRLVRGRAGHGDVVRLNAEAAKIDGRGACSHPDGAVRLLSSALATFADDVDEHVHRSRCREGNDGRVFPVPGRE
jgi:NADH:ubiquinone oxidoreductase subunit F (NADH-binding)